MVSKNTLKLTTEENEKYLWLSAEDIDMFL